MSRKWTEEELAAIVKKSAARVVHPLGPHELATDDPPKKTGRKLVGEGAESRRQEKRKAARKAEPKVYRESAGEAELRQQLALSCNEFVRAGWIREYRFHADRMWRLDFAWPAAKLGVEIDGGTWSNGRHVRGEGFARDAEKGNAAIMLGWRILHYTPEMVKNGTALAQISQFLKQPAA